MTCTGLNFCLISILVPLSFPRMTIFLWTPGESGGEILAGTRFLPLPSKHTSTTNQWWGVIAVRTVIVTPPGDHVCMKVQGHIHALEMPKNSPSPIRAYMNVHYTAVDAKNDAGFLIQQSTHNCLFLRVKACCWVGEGRGKQRRLKARYRLQYSVCT